MDTIEFCVFLHPVTFSEIRGEANMPSWHRDPENARSVGNIASMRQPRGPFHDNETKASYILAYRAYEAGHIRSRDIAGKMTDSGFSPVSERTMREWAAQYPDLPEQRARESYLPSRKLPKEFSDQLQGNIRWANLGQQEHKPGFTLAEFLTAVGIGLVARWGLRKLSKPTSIIERPEESGVGSRIGRVGRRRIGFFRTNHQ